MGKLERRKKETGKRAEHDGKGEEIPCDFYIYIYFLAFLLGYPAEPLRRREESYGWEVGRPRGVGRPLLSPTLSEF